MTTNAWVPEPSDFSKTMRYLSGLLMPGVVWVPFGHLFLGSSGGWMIFIGLLYFLPMYIVVCGAHSFLWRAYARRLGTRALGPWSSAMTLIFLIVMALYPFAVTDFGDAPDSYAPSAIQRILDLDNTTAGSVQGVVTAALFAAAVLMIAADIVDLVRLNRAPARSGWVPPSGVPSAKGYNIWSGAPRDWPSDKKPDQGGLPPGSNAWQ